MGYGDSALHITSHEIVAPIAQKWSTVSVWSYVMNGTLTTIADGIIAY